MLAAAGPAPYVLIVAAALAVAAGIGMLVADPATALLLDDVSQDGTGLVVAAALIWTALFRRTPARGIQLGLGIAVLMVATSMTMHDLERGGSTDALEDILTAGAIVVAMLVGTVGMSRGGKPHLLVAAWLDAVTIVAAAAACVAVTSADPFAGQREFTYTVPALVILLSVWAVGSVVVLVSRSIMPRPIGPYGVLAGIELVGLAGLIWVLSVADGAVITSAAPTDFLFCIGVLLIGAGGLCWSMDPDPRLTGSTLLDQARDLVPTGAIMIAVLVSLLVVSPGNMTTLRADVARWAIIAGVCLAACRQTLLKVWELRARRAGELAAERLAAEVRDRQQVARIMSDIERGATGAETAQRICERVTGIDGVGFSIFVTGDGSGAFVPIAASGFDHPVPLGQPLPQAHTDHLRSRIQDGAWRDSSSPWLDAWVGDRPAADVTRLALRYEGHVVGILTLGCWTRNTSEDAARRLLAIREIGTVASATLGPVMLAEELLRARRAAIDWVIAERAFHAVFQPIVDLATRVPKGYEALTRFDDGIRPDIRFQEADATGRGLEMEIATLQEATRAAALLPAGTYLSLNLSPQLATRPDLLGPLLTRVPRDLLLEITEHVPVEDYGLLMASLYALDLRIRIAVDDAGSGYSGLHHILTVRPHVVKLDQSLVRSVDLDLARQAMVRSMADFARRTGATVVAEGVETEGEATMLVELGVELGQGYLLGRPARLVEPAQDRPTAA